MIAAHATEWCHNSRTRFRTVILLSLLLPPAALATEPGGISPRDNTLVTRALAAELKAAQDTAHPMQYRLRKSTPRLTSTRQIIETSDGAVARLLLVNDITPSPADRQKDDARLDGLLADPTRQARRKQGELNDTARAVKVLRVLPKAFLFQYAGTVSNSSGTIERYTFVPNPKFTPSDLELTVLTAMTGELQIDAVHERVVRLEGHLGQDVDFGWGILGRLHKGGWLVIEQGEVGDGLWRVLRIKLEMSGRVFIKTRSFDTAEEQSQFARVPASLTYRQAIDMLRTGQKGSLDARGK
jgi:hypothetical protein